MLTQVTLGTCFCFTLVFVHICIRSYKKTVTRHIKSLVFKQKMIKILQNITKCYIQCKHGVH